MPTENLAQKYKAITEKLGQETRTAAKLGREEITKLDTQTRAIKRPRKRERSRCEAKTRTGGSNLRGTGGPCQAPAVRGGSRCRLHGGKPFDGPTLHARILRRQRAELLRLVKIAEILSR